MTDFIVNEGIYLLALLGIPFLLALVFFIALRSSRAVPLWFSRNEFLLHFPWIRMAARIGAVLFMAIALIGISIGGRSERTIATYGREIYILLDVSASMLTEDVKPNRLEKVKRELKRTVNSLKGDKFGLIVFTSDAFVQCPLTTDKDAVNLFLDLVNPSQFSNTGTDFRAPLSMALDRFENVEKADKRSSRCIILLSDGEDFGDSYESVLDRLKSQEIEVFTVGVGTEAGGNVPEYVNGEKKGLKKGEDGKPAVSHVKDESLKNIAESFGTTYFRIDEQMDNLDPIEDQVRMVSASQTGSRQEKMAHNFYQIPLVISFLLLIFSMIFAPIRKPQSQITHDRT